MTKLIARTLHNTGELIIKDAPLAKGGEGAVHIVETHNLPDLDDADDLVAKIYFQPEEANRGPKVVAMLSNPPEDQESIAWVKAIVFDENKKFAGYIMPKLDTKNYRQWSELANTKDRLKTADSFSVQYALNAARNFAVALSSIHDAGHMVGDINESNLFVSTDSTVMLVDMDSAQISFKDKTYPCYVGKPEFTAQELSHGKLKDNPRTVASDIFAYSVILFQILTGGAHPMDGIYQPDDDPPDVTNKIRMGVLPTLQPNLNKNFKPVPRIPADAIPLRLKAVMIDGLSADPAKRPNADKYIDVLDDVFNNLVQCKKEKLHYYDARDGKCGWCIHKENGNFDPWSKVSPQQQAAKKKNLSQNSLPSMNFADSAAAGPAPRAQRAPIQRASQQAPQGSQTAQNVPQRTQPSYPQQSTAQGSHVAPQAGETQKPAGPEKHKGKIVLTYADGSRRVRPPLTQLFQANAKMGMYAVREETPVIAQAWWNPRRDVASVAGMMIGIVLALLVAGSWFFTVPLLNNLEQIPDKPIVETIIYYYSLVSIGTSAIAGFSLFFSALMDRRKTKKQFGQNFEHVPQENTVKTILRFIGVSIIYGPLIIALGVLLAIFAILSALLDAVASSNGR